MKVARLAPTPVQSPTQAAVESPCAFETEASTPTTFPNSFARTQSAKVNGIAAFNGPARANFAPGIDGLQVLSTMADFELLSKQNNRPGARGIKEVKFLIVGINTTAPKLYFVNANKHQYHFDFYSAALGNHRIDNDEFSLQTYFRDDRKNLAGTLVFHEGKASVDSTVPTLAMEFWPTDPVNAVTIGKAFKAIEAAAPAFADKLRYHPAGTTQEALFKRDQATLDALNVRTVSTDALFANQTFTTMNPGVGFGQLRVIDPTVSGQRPASMRDVVIFKSIPNDLSHTGGVITEAPQTNLSHVNLKAIQNRTPNAYVKNASTDPKIQALLGKMVRYEVTDQGFDIREATAEEAETYLESQRPSEVTKLTRTLTVRTIKPLSSLQNKDQRAFGAKSANLGELQRILSDGMVPKGFGVPFWFYDRFMRETGLYAEAQTMMNDPEFKSDVAKREEMLSAFRRKIRRADVPVAMAATLADMQAKFPVGSAIRCRSSTNNEDLEGFNGAGLYDSYTHRPDEGHIAETVKQVWSSLWNFRAFEEREFYRIDHMSAAMAVAVHPNTDEENVNGVAVTKNIYDPNWKGFYVNAQAGESLVTNPDPGATPDEILISAIGPRGEYETQYLQRSSLVDANSHLMTPSQLAQLTLAMEKIQTHFAMVYRKRDDKNFAMDIEFKFTKDGALQVKQARPWVNPG